MRAQSIGGVQRAIGQGCLGVLLLIANGAGIGSARAQTVEYIHTDALGTPTAVTDANRVVIERSEYEPYGKLLNRPLSDGLGFTGHVQDMATGMTYMQQRYYDPILGRFLSVDPVTANSGTGANFNRYWYANNNPYRFTDPDGRLACNRQEGCEHLSPFYRGIPLWQSGGSSTNKQSKKSRADLPKLPDREVSADGERSVGESWERVTRYTENQKIVWFEPSEAQWRPVPVVEIATLFVKSNVFTKVAAPEFEMAKKRGFLALEYQVGYKHVFNSLENGRYSENRDVYNGYGTIWTNETFWKLDTSERGEVSKYVFRAYSW